MNTSQGLKTAARNRFLQILATQGATRPAAVQYQQHASGAEFGGPRSELIMDRIIDGMIDSQPYIRPCFLEPFWWFNMFNMFNCSTSTDETLGSKVWVIRSRNLSLTNEKLPDESPVWFIH